jgi:predicted ester cyclase
MSEKNKTAIRRLIDEFWNAKNSSVIDELFAPDAVIYDAGVSLPNLGKEFFTAIRSVFSDIQLTADDMVAEGDKVALCWTSRGTHRCELQGISPTNRQVTVTGITIYRFAGDRIVEEWNNADMFGMLRQLGVVAS